MVTETKDKLVHKIDQFLKDAFHIDFADQKEFQSNPLWRRFKEIGTTLWLDTGSIDDAEGLWTREYSALTTNNTLLNKEIQTGQYDSLIGRVVELLDEFEGLTERERLMEIAFVLNAWHGLRLVERFGASVSVEEHTDLANDVDGAVDYGIRYHEICPERFIVKVPLTPAGLLAARRLSGLSVPVNLTLGFSARQNYVAAWIAKPAYVNVFLGRLNSFVADNNLGNGIYIGERATLASQNAIEQLRRITGIGTRQIAASLRNGQQLLNLAGVDVITSPPKVSAELLGINPDVQTIANQRLTLYEPYLNHRIEPDHINLDSLWKIDDQLVDCVNALEGENLDVFTPDDLIGYFKDYKCGDLLIGWNSAEMSLSKREGKIPEYRNWKGALRKKIIGLDSLMNLAGLNSFITDQEAMDGRIRDIMAKNSVLGR